MPKRTIAGKKGERHFLKKIAKATNISLCLAYRKNKTFSNKF